MKIVAVSDTHGNEEILEEIVRCNQSADLFLHLGDGEREYESVRNRYPRQAFLMVKGNNDWGDYPPAMVLPLKGFKLYLTHGNRFERSSLLSFLAASAKANECDLALFGHTHVPCDETVGGVRLFNPGSPSLPRGGNAPSYGIVTLNENGADFRHIFL